MNYLLDTNACIAIINGNPEPVRARFRLEATADNRILISSVVSFELWYGVAKSTRKEFNSRRLEAFFAGPVAILPFELEDARLAGYLRADLQASGKPIGAYDLLIAGQAIRRKLTLVTANAREFARVNGLLWQDWAKTEAR